MENLENLPTKENTPTCEIKTKLYGDELKSSKSNEKFNPIHRKFLILKIFQILFDNAYDEFIKVEKDLFYSLLNITDNYNSKETDIINLQIKRKSYRKIKKIINKGNVSLFNLIYSFMILDDLIFQFPSIFSEVSFEK